MAARIMTERIDHATNAKAILANTKPEEFGTTANWLAAAQVHATLALVEQQRIANLIAMATQPGGGHDVAYEALVYTEDENGWPVIYQVRPEIKEALGLS
jgi:hypothetical protein